MFNKVQRYSIRKLTIGAVSVMIGMAFVGINGQTVHADTAASAQTEVTKNSDKAAASNEDNQSLNNDKGSDSSSNLPDQNNNEDRGTSKASAPISAGQKNTDDSQSASTADEQKTAAKGTEQNKQTDNAQNKANDNKSNNDTNDNKSANNELVIDKSGKNQTDSEKKNELANALKEEKLVGDDSKIQLKKAKAGAPNQDPTPVPLHYEVGTNYIYVVVGTDIKDNPARLFKNGQELLNAGAKLSWTTAVPTFTNEDYSTPKPATIRVTYADGKHTDVNVTISGEPQVTLQPKTFYYVKNVGDKVDFSQPDSNYNDYDTIIDIDGVYSTSEMSYEPVGTIDTSTVGIHWAKIKVTDNGLPDGITKVVGDPYYVEIPYIVQGLKLRDDITKDAAGNPIINAQLASQPQGTRGVPTTPVEEFAPNNGNTPLLGQYFYQDYALAYALGITTSIDGWTQPTDLINTKSNSFKLVLNYNNGSGAYKLGDSKEQTIDVHYVAAPHIDNIYFYNDGHTYFAGQTANLQTVKKMVDSGMLDKYIYVTLADGTKVYAKTITSIRQLFKGIGGAGTGVFQAGFKATFGGTNSAGQPLIFNDNDLGDSTGLKAGAGFNDAVNYWYRKTNDTYDTANFGTLADNTWDRLSTTAYALAPTVREEKDKLVADVTDGPVTYNGDDLSKFIKNPETAKELNKYLDSINAGWDWTPPTNKLNTISKWPEGTKFEWSGIDGFKTLSFDKAGEIKTGDIKITLPTGPTGSTTVVKDITIESKANVKAQSRTIDYGKTLTAADLVTNKDRFPEGTTFKYVDGSEPDWYANGSYNNVQIIATYKDANGNTITTDPATCAVAINDTRTITVLEGSSLPSVGSILNFASNWATHTASWSKDINTDSTNQGEITVHYGSSHLDQKIRVFVTVIPKTTAIDGEQFLTNGNKYDGTAGSIANGTTNQGSILTNAGSSINYASYNGTGTPGVPSTFTQEQTSYSPKFSLSGLQTNADGSLVSGVQNVTVHVSVPKGTLGAKVDDAGNYYYELKTNIEVAQPVTFEFVDDDDNETTVGTPQTQEFLKGKATTIAPALTIPINYVLAAGQTLPTSYTLANYSKTNPVVQIHLKHKAKDITVSFTGNKSKAYDGKAATLPDDVTTNTAITATGMENSDQFVLTGLTADDFDWYQGSTKLDSAPKDAGNYIIKVNAAGLAKLQANNTNYSFTAIGGTYTYTINKATASAALSGSGQRTYDGSAVSDNDIQKQDANNNITLKVTIPGQTDPAIVTLKVDDFDWSQGTTKLTAVPENAGTYILTLNAAGKQAIGNQLSSKHNIDWTHLDFTNIGSATYTINKKAATIDLSGNDGKNYDGTAGTIDPSKGSFTVDSSTPLVSGENLVTPSGSNALTAGDFDWYNAAGTRLTSAPTAAGTYTLKLKDSGLSKLAAANANYELTVSGGITYTISSTGISGSYSGSYSTTYDGQSVNVSDITTPTWSISAGSSPISDFSHDGLKNSDFDWTDAAGNAVSVTDNAGPKQAGTYTLKLNAQGLSKLQGDNSNYSFTLDDLSGSYTITINKKAATIDLSGNDGKNYDGTAGTIDPSKGSFTVDSSTPLVSGENLVTPSGSNALTAGDFDWYNAAGTRLTSAPTAAGTYTLKLKDSGLSKLAAANANYELTVSGGITYTISSTGISGSYSGSYSTTYDGQSVNVSDITTPTWSISAGSSPISDFSHDGLKNSDFDWTDAAGNAVSVTDNAGPKQAGTYTLKLNAQGLSKLQGDNSNYSFTLDDLSGSYTITINKKAATIDLSGNDGKNYDGTAGTIDPSKGSFTVDSSTPLVSGENLVTPSGSNALTAGDFDWYNAAGTRLTSAPTAAGTYTLKLKDSGLSKLAAANANYELTVSGGITYTISSTGISGSYSGSYSTTYDGQSVNVSDITTPTWSISAGSSPISDFSHDGLKNSDFDWTDAAGNAVSVTDNAGPKQAGTYTLKLNAQGLSKLQGDNSNYSFTLDDLSGSYTITINKKAATIDLSGNDGKNYDGTAGTIDPSKGSFTVDSSTPLVSGENLVTPSGSNALTAGDFDWYNAAGTRLTSAPTAAGTYTLKLKDSGLSKLAAANANYELTVSGGITYTISSTGISGSYSGSYSTTYDGQSVNVSDITTPTWSISAGSSPISDFSHDGLKNSDFDWTDAAGNAVSVTDNAGPKQAGTYTLKLNAQGLSKLQGDNSNYSFTLDDLSGSYTITINKKAATIDLSGNDGKNYDGTAGTIDPSKGSFTVDSSTPLVSGENLVTPSGSNALTAGDFDWYNAAGTRLTSAPTAAGTYTLKLKDSGLSKLAAANANYELTVSGGITYKITAEITAVLSGSGQRTYNGSPVSDTDIQKQDANNNITLTVTISGQTNPANVTLTANDFNWNNSAIVPKDVGTYTLTLNDMGKQAIRDQLGSNHNIDWTNITVSGHATYTINPKAPDHHGGGSGNNPGPTPTPPTQPSQKTNGGSIKPSQPTQSSGGNKPSKPGKPTKPGKPVKPIKPGKTVKPELPDHPKSNKGSTKSKSSSWSQNRQPYSAKSPLGRRAALPELGRNRQQAGQESQIGQASAALPEVQNPASAATNEANRSKGEGLLRSRKALPETGNNQQSNNWLAFIGAAFAAVASLFGFAIKKKKKE